MAEKRKKQAAVFARDESTFVKESSVKGADTTHKGKEKYSGTNQICGNKQNCKFALFFKKFK